MVNDLLFELGTEELPSAAVFTLGDMLANNLVTLLKKANLSHDEVRFFATPRRLAVLVKALVTTQPSQRIARRGPAVSQASDAQGKPTAALMGFAKSCGVAVDALTTQTTDKGAWWVYEGIEEGAQTAALLPGIVQQAIADLAIAKPMRWGDGDALFARPVHWAVLLFGKDVIPCTVLGVAAGRASLGHRFHHPHAVTITQPDAYEACLMKAQVVADFAKRKKLIQEQVQTIANAHQFCPVMPEDLLDEVTSIVEWPEALLASFSKEFLTVPAEALIAAMQSHQKCFAIRNQAGELLAHFITIANIASHNPKQVIAGNEKVMRARLSDAAFFFNQDKRQSLADYLAETKQVVYQQRLGSLYDKMLRLQGLMEHLSTPLGLDNAKASRAAYLSKCDLMTGMVGEFPELQGLMGYYYAKNDNEDDAVALALNEQYRPRFAADQLPQTLLGVALSLADRLDTLVGIFAIGLKPSGVKDPFKLRRHALAVVRLLLSTPAPLNLSTLLRETAQLYGNVLSIDDTVLEAVRVFILERVHSYYQSQGVSADIVHAALAGQQDWLYDLDKRIQALLACVNTQEVVSLSQACKRVNNMLGQATVTQQGEQLPTVNEKLLVAPEELALYHAMNQVASTISLHYSAAEYSQVLSQLASLRQPVDAFFDQVMVMVEEAELKANRLNLLACLRDLLRAVADISLLQQGND